MFSLTMHSTHYIYGYTVKDQSNCSRKPAATITWATNGQLGLWPVIHRDMVGMVFRVWVWFYLSILWMTTGTNLSKMNELEQFDIFLLPQT